MTYFRALHPARIFCGTALLLVLMFFGGAAFADELKLTSDTMRYDSATGFFDAEGNVKITRGEMLVTARKAEGNMSSGEIHLVGDVHISGSWEGEEVDIKGQILSGTLREPRGVSFQGTVRGVWGSRQVDAEDLRMKGNSFSASTLRRYIDKTEGFSFSCRSIEGKMEDGRITEFTASGAFSFTTSPPRGTPTRIQGDRAVYSLARGSLVVTGNVSAVQDGRSLRSESLIYFPKQNRVEATGSPQLIFKLNESKP